MNPFYHALLAGYSVPVVVGLSPALSTGQTSAATLFWPMIYKSSLYPNVTTTKEYFLLYSTDHASGDGGIWWGEFDNFEGEVLNGFIERGLIKSGNQCETPFLIEVPTTEIGYTNDTLLLYYHTNASETGNENKQQTRLMTTSGGLLHTATWTDRGRPLGIVTGENHTGYLRVWKRGEGDYIGHHMYNTTVPVSSGKVSIATNPGSFTRLVTFDGNEGLPTGGSFERSTLQAFQRNSKIYGIFLYYSPDSYKYIAIAELDPDTYLPSILIKTLHQSNLRTLKSYTEDDTAYVLFKNGNSGDLYNTDPYYMIKYDLTDLD